MDAPGKVPDTINCHACGAVIDLAGQTGLTHIECTRCGSLSVVPLQFGNFLLLNPLGIGGMGTVYKAIDLSLNRYLALKILRKKLAANPEFIETFSREARSAAAVNHPNVAQVYSFGEQDGQYYLAMELLDRGSLDDRILKLGKLSEAEVLDIGALIASGLRAAYQRGLLHRDVKPGNILFNSDGVPKIVDFGLAQIHAPAATQPIPTVQQAQSEQIWGTPYYIAPEKLRGQPEDFRSDVYSLGASLFHALAGRPPFEAATAGEVVTKHATQPAYSLKTYAPNTHDYTAHVIARMLAKNPAERYESYDEAIHDLREAQSVLKAAEQARAIVAPTGEQFSFTSIIGTIAAVIACGAIVWFVWQNRVGIFRLESAPQQTTAAPTAVEHPSTSTAPETSPRPATTTEEVDFTEDAPWVKAWNMAALQLAQGRYEDALIGYDNALQLAGRDRPLHRQWIFVFQGLTLLAADRPSESQRVFIRAVDLRAGRRVPETITTDNFAPVVAQMMLGGLPLAELEGATERMPPWAAALTHLAAGFKHMEAGEFSAAADAFRRYHKLPVDDRNRWAFNLQSLADKLARQCDDAARVLELVAGLEKEEKFDTALETLQAAAKNTKLTALKAALLTREAQLEQAVGRQREQQAQTRGETERRAQERAAQEQQRIAEEKKLLQALEPEVAPAWQSYDFKASQAKYGTLAGKMETAEGRRLLEQRVATAKLLADFKSQLAADFARRPYDRADLQTRNLSQLSGRLVRATEGQLVFATPYGELVTDWRDLAPATLVKLAEFYATTLRPAEKPEQTGRRYLALAVFCKQYGMDRAAAAYERQAMELMPSLRDEAEKILGKATN